MKLFIVLVGCLLVVAALTWITLRLDRIQKHHDEMKRAREAAAAQHPH
jgi:hypothetical protein